jgi:5'(3')-deoxyribonucleotidase
MDDKVMWGKIWTNWPDWFATLDPMPDMELLWNYTKHMKPIVLTAASRINVYSTVQQKIAWVHHHLGPDVPVIVCMRSHKKDYANSDAILIDDHKDNIKHFQQHGGTVFFHTTAAMSIAQLESYL